MDAESAEAENGDPDNWARATWDRDTWDRDTWERDTWDTGTWDADDREPEHGDVDDRDAASGESASGEPVSGEAGSVQAVTEPAPGMPAAGAATVGEPAADDARVPAEARDPEAVGAAPPAPPGVPPEAPLKSTGRRLSAPVRLLAFILLLIGLVLAGLMFGRMLRDSDGDGGAKPATSAATPRPKAPVVRSERWGPLEATPAGRLAKPAARAAVARTGTVPAGTKVAVLGGTAGNAVQLGAAGGALRPVAKLPSARASAAAFGGNGAVFLIGGERGAEAPTDQILRFDLASHKVTQAGTFIEPLAGAGYAQSGRSLLLAGGWTGDTFATAVLRVALPDDATLVARLPVALRDPAVALRGGKLYVAGGRGESGLTNQVYVVELASGTVSVLGRLPQPVAGASLVVAGGQLYLLGGRAASGPVAAVVHINPTTGSIARAGSMPRPLAGAATVQVGGATLVIGGTQSKAVFRLRAG